MSVNESSPREVKDFYGAVFKPIDDIIAANAAHNRMVNLIAREEGAPLIDMAAGVDGKWDDDLYLDIVHFTEAGNERVAALMFRALLPILAERHGVHCDRCICRVGGDSQRGRRHVALEPSPTSL